MYISGILIGKDDRYAVIRQAWTGTQFVVRLKELEFEHYKDKSLVKYEGKYSVRISNCMEKDFCRVEMVKRVGNKLVWKVAGKTEYRSDLQG